MSLTKCTDPINRESCINIHNRGEVCIWINDACSFYESGEPCDNLNSINTPSACARATDKCVYES